jgi:hypothetical protein
VSSNVLPFPQPAPIGRIPDEAPAAAPTVSGDSPYTPLNLPPVETKHPMPDLGKEADPQNLGAVSHAGAVAFLADKVLRGAVQGIAQKQAHQQDQYNKKLSAQQTVFNDVSKQFHDIDHSAKAGSFTGPPGPDGQPTFVPSKEWKDAQNRVLAVWQPLMATMGEKIPQQGKGKKKQSDNPVSQVYAAAVQTGPAVFHQSPSPAERRGYLQGAQTAATQATTQGIAATAGQDTETAKARLASLIAKPDQTDQDKAEIDKIKEQLSPLPKTTGVTNMRYRKGPNGETMEYRVDPSGNEIPDTERPLSTAASVPKPLQYDPKTDQVVDVKSGKRWSVGEKGMPVEVASVFKGANSATFEKQQRALQLLGAHTDAALSSHAVQVPDPNNPGNTIWMPVGQAIKTGASGTGSAEHKGAVNEEAGLVKQELDAKKDFSNASTNLSMMLKTSDAAKKGDGSAQVGILANYLKTVVGGQGTGLRITKAEWDAAAKTRPWMTGIQATFSPAGIMTGAAIAPSQVDQMIQEVHQKTKALHETYQSAQQAAHAPKAVTPKETPETHVFDSKAWAAANPKGDVEAAKTAAKAKGYEVQ